MVCEDVARIINQRPDPIKPLAETTKSKSKSFIALPISSVSQQGTELKKRDPSPSIENLNLKLNENTSQLSPPPLIVSLS